MTTSDRAASPDLLANPARLAAGAVAGFALLAFAAQTALAGREMGTGALVTLWRVLAFFTMLSTLALACALAAVAAGRWPGGRRPSAPALGGLAVTMVFLGLVYYAMIAPGRPLSGLALWVDAALHAGLPLAALGFWWRFAPKQGLRPRHAAIWAAWPLLYAALALLRGRAEGWYPYFFLDPGQVGAAGVALHVAALTLLFAVLGLALVALGRRAARGRR